jgi:hypothetical protein
MLHDEATWELTWGTLKGNRAVTALGQSSEPGNLAWRFAVTFRRAVVKSLIAREPPEAIAIMPLAAIKCD